LSYSPAFIYCSVESAGSEPPNRIEVEPSEPCQHPVRVAAKTARHSDNRCFASAAFVPHAVT